MSGEPTSAEQLKGKRGLRRLRDATRYSLDGLRAAWRHEDAFRQEVVVLVVELLNTAIEAAIDRDSLRIDPLAKRAKDYGSAAVMLALVLAGGTWVAILVHRFVL
jgi:diacylglycerol kinase (ATP)